MKKSVRHLRLLIPKFECIEGCTDCCGPVPFSSWEWSRVSDKRKATCNSCPYASPAGCAIYDDRPIMCRLFGAVEDPLLTCPHGRGPEKKLTLEEANRIGEEYARLTGDDICGPLFME